MHLRGAFICCAGFLLLGRAYGQNGRDDIYYDALSGNCYRQNPDQSFRRLGSLPHEPRGRSLALHILNVNTYGKRIAVVTKDVSLFQETPTGFSASALIGKVIPPSAATTLSKMGINMRSADGKDPVDELKDQIDTFNRQCSAFKEISNLDTSLKSMAAYGEEPVPVPNPKDPRQPGLVASQHMAAKFKAYLAKLFADSGTPSIASKGAAAADGAAVTPDDLDTLADAKASEIKTTFSDIQQNYYSVRQVLATNVPTTTSKSAAAAPISPTPVGQAALTLQQQLDQAYAQAQQNEEAIDLDAASRESRLQSAAALYKKLTTENIYQYDGPACLTNADEVVFTIQVFDANVALPPPTAAQVLSEGSATSLANALPGFVSKGTAPTGAQGGKKPGAGGAPSGPPSFPGVPGAAAAGKASPEGLQSGDRPQAQYEVPVYMTGRLKLDFSSGLFLTDLVNANYRTVALSATSFKIASGAQSKNEVGIGGLMHVYVTSAWDVVPALSLGLAQGVDGNTEYLFGGSLIAGHDQRFILSGGLAASSVQRLDGLSVGSTISSTTIPVRSVLRLGWFLGLTYNLK